ncbi:KH domain-containing, RNA-binding, signal transduction-associated protein 3 isoform X2 [Dendrobates tinctorius]|uniref:KH domain-containing, RNA-binding, signal transduction-associated protein 3 isoform X2 n=1 Tax=Dendrobates tinctorius TaxID=92724 RepID=UPI003CCA4169
MEKYLPQLLAEKDALDPSFTHALRMVTEEIEKIQKGEENMDSTEDQYIDVVINKNMKLAQKVLIPIKQFPKFNFVGKLLGPRGNSLKRLQEDTLTKMSILGKGSMRDKAKEEELRKSGEAKYFHLNDDLHVLIEVFAPPAEAYARMGHALDEIKKFLIPDYNDEIRQAQLQELTYLNGGSENDEVPVVRGKQSVRARGTQVTALSRGRGGVPPSSVGVPRGAPAPRGVTPARVPSTRARGLLASRARGIPHPAGYRPPPPAQDTYGEYDYDDGYGTAYDEQSYDSYDNNYNSQVQSTGDYYDYGHGLGEDSYESYGIPWVSVVSKKAYSCLGPGSDYCIQMLYHCTKPRTELTNSRKYRLVWDKTIGQIPDTSLFPQDPQKEPTEINHMQDTDCTV